MHDVIYSAVRWSKYTRAILDSVDQSTYRLNGVQYEVCIL
jgi:hypothetical protein